MGRWTVVTTPVPSTVEGPWSWHLHGAARVSREYEASLWGHSDLHEPPVYVASQLCAQTYTHRTMLVAVPAAAPDPQAEDVVGVAWAVLPQKDNTHLGYVSVLVHPDSTGQGAGRALADAAEALVAEAGRTTVITWSEHVGEPSPDDAALEPPTGSGRIRPDDRGATFAHARGYVLEQAERYSMLRLPVDPAELTRLRDGAAAVAGEDYRTVWWTDRCPDAWVDQLAVLKTRMSTDVPSADLEMHEEAWDAERIRTAEADADGAGLGTLTVAAEHVPTGTLAAYTYVRFPRPAQEVVFQEDTLVLSEHRGRRLGMLVKATLLERLREVRPRAARVHTWNAEENSHMLGINVALGFRPMGVAGMWQRRDA